ncbi:MAG: hypothetical protein ACFFDW_16030 [Candidatus Thorarchaeota archaeon]
MQEKTIQNETLSYNLEEKEKIENKVRSNLRYAWQKTIAFILYYNPTVKDIEQNLSENFLIFIPLDNPLRNKIEKVILEAFNKKIDLLLKAKDITNYQIEDEFIAISVEKLRGILF